MHFLFKGSHGNFSGYDTVCMPAAIVLGLVLCVCLMYLSAHKESFKVRKQTAGFTATHTHTHRGEKECQAVGKLRAKWITHKITHRETQHSANTHMPY